MITVSEALTFDKVALTRDEREIYTRMERTIDSAIFKHFDGGSFSVKEPATNAPKKVVLALKRTYEAGGWRVEIALTGEGSEATYTLLFIPLPGFSPAKAAKKEPPLLATPLVTHKRLLVRMPTRGRPEQALRVLQKYRDMAGAAVKIEVVVDHDDASMQQATVLQRLVALDVVITVGWAKNKVEACNGGRVWDWDVLLLASDDMVPVTDGWAVHVLAAMEKHWPHDDGALYFDDGYQGANCCTLPIMGRRFWNRFGYVYHPHYQSLWCDVEQTELWKSMNRLVYIDEKIIEHRHPATGKADKDALYDRNDALWTADEATFRRRKALTQPDSQFVFGITPLWLSICIATLPTRRARLEHLVDHLYYQAAACSCLGDIEIVVDAGSGTVGEKRQRLLQKARGHFVSFVDDDDWVAHDYVERVVLGIIRNRTADCLALRGMMTVDGEKPMLFEHSIMHREWKNEPTRYLRSPNHLNPVRRELALKAGFPPTMHGEDFEYSKNLLPLLECEANTGDAPLYYYFFTHGPAGQK